MPCVVITPVVCEINAKNAKVHPIIAGQTILHILVVIPRAKTIFSQPGKFPCQNQI